MVNKIFSFLLIIIVQFYRYFISPFTLASCRHVPTCSEYAIQSIKKFGPLKGAILATKRLSNCHPWGTHGYDPVPKIIVKKYKSKSKFTQKINKYNSYYKNKIINPKNSVHSRHD